MRDARRHGARLHVRRRTADGWISLGGRGLPYRFGSRADNEGRTQAATVEALRDWCATVTLDRSSGLGWAGGYVGSGVATANPGARTLRELVRMDSGQGGRTELTELPWVGHKGRKWEPEPLRRLGVHGLYATCRAADRRERAFRSAESSRPARIADRVAGRHRRKFRPRILTRALSHPCATIASTTDDLGGFHV